MGPYQNTGEDLQADRQLYYNHTQWVKKRKKSRIKYVKQNN